MSIVSLQQKLFNVSKEQDIQFQVILNRFGAERFLALLSISDYKMNLVFKGGALLAYLIESDRKTKDLDFSLKQLNTQIDDLVNIINDILNIQSDDGIEWMEAEGEKLEHNLMPYPGARIKCPFKLGKMKGQVWLDIALGDDADPIEFQLPVIQYKGEPLIPGEINLNAYSAESVFAEKYQTLVRLKEANSRMRDYYDLYKLIESNNMNNSALKIEIIRTFKARKTDLVTQIKWDGSVVSAIQNSWSAYLKKQGLRDTPQEVRSVLKILNEKLKKVF